MSLTVPYTTAEILWEEGLGNHRALIRADETGGPEKAVFVRVPWRRRDPRPGRKRIVITARDGRRVKNILRLSVTPDRADLVFQPLPGADEYCLYYLPFKPQRTHGYFRNDYLRREPLPSPFWLIRVGLAGFRKGEVTGFQSRSEFDSFYPMEVPLTQKEEGAFFRDREPSWFTVAENREYPIRMTRKIPVRWLEREDLTLLEGDACRNEYFAFQVGIVARDRKLSDIRAEFPGLGPLPPEAFTCYNTHGVDIDGRPFRKTVDLPAGKIQSLWIGVDIPESIVPGTYSGTVDIITADSGRRQIRLNLTIRNEVLPDRGDSDPRRFSRIRWLNSAVGLDDSVIPPFAPLLMEGRTVTCSRRTMVLEKSGLPGAVSAVHPLGRGGEPESLLSGPVRFIAERKENGAVQGRFPSLNSIQPELKFHRIEPGVITWTAGRADEELSLRLEGRTEPDGYSRYALFLKALRDVSLRDTRLEIPLEAETAEYFMGMGCRGGRMPAGFSSRWRGPWNSCWAGNTTVGLHCTFLGSEYEGPLQKLYRPVPPPSWYNRGKGRVTLKRKGKTAVLTASSGRRTLRAGETIRFEFSLIITPVKQLDPAAQFRDRYYHHPLPGQDAVKGGAKVANIHHATDVNPYINYPFLRNRELTARIGEFREQGLKTKVYYTVRELTSRVTELPFLLSLGDEILSRSPRKGPDSLFMKSHPWLREHIDDGFGAEWFAPLEDRTVDAALLTSGESRWYNYYLEGLDWMIKNLGIDGLYLDDVSYDRRILKRMRRILEQKPGCLIDLHSNTGFSRGPAVQYTGFFPYINKVWFGESFRYNRMSPDQWLVERSGIPFGHMGDMLQDGGNRWRGMVYGMTVRLPWVSERNRANPLPVWKVWDDFGIEQAEMTGYWEKDCPVRTDHPDIRATVYRREDRVLIAAASWAKVPRKSAFRIDWQALNLDPRGTVMRLPGVRDFQRPSRHSPGDPLMYLPGRGYLVYLEKSR